MSKAKKKRFYKEGPHSLSIAQEEESDMEDEITSYGTGLLFENDESIKEEEVILHQESDEEENVRVCQTDSKRILMLSMEETQESYWARGCSECEIEMEGVRRLVRALLDSRLEVNLMSREIYEEEQWIVDRDIQWKVNSMNATKMSYGELVQM